MGKRAEAVSIIGGADGPTSVFIAGKGKDRRSIRQRMQAYFYRRKKDRIKKSIIANPHTLEETIAYIREVYHAAESSRKSYNFKEQRNCLRESLILAHKPELLGDLARIELPGIEDEGAVREYLDQCRLRSERVRTLGEEEFPLDFHLFEIPVSSSGRIEVMIESRWEKFGVSYNANSGDKKLKKQLKKMYQEIYLYYGVSQEDIKNRSERYSSLVMALSM